MLTCLPSAFCSWDYRVFGLSTGSAELSFNFMGESGGIRVAGEELPLVKHGWLSGRWTLEREGQICAEASKPGIFRTFEIQTEALAFTVEAQSAFSRVFNITVGGEVAGEIYPAHLFTRRAFIECHPTVPEIAQLFAFWLVALNWRRHSRRHH
jgi:hypothetical protein